MTYPETQEETILAFHDADKQINSDMLGLRPPTDGGAP